MDDDLLIEELGTLMLAYGRSNGDKASFKKRLNVLYASGNLGDEAYDIIAKALGISPRGTASEPSIGKSRPSYNDYSTCAGHSYGSSC